MSAMTWSTIASLATALGTLILAVATFSAVRSSNLMAKVAQQQLLVQLRPVLTTTRRDDPVLKVNFGDTKVVEIPGGGAVSEVDAGDGSLGPDTPVVYLAIGLRNAGSGIAVLHGWRFFPGWHRDAEQRRWRSSSGRTGTCTSRPAISGSGRARSVTPRTRATTARGRPSKPGSRGR